MRARLQPLFLRYLVDLVIVLAAAAGIAQVVVDEHNRLPWDDVAPLAARIPVVLAITLPFLARRRFPFAAPAAALVALAALSFAEEPVLEIWPLPIVVALTATFLFGLLRDRRQALAGSAIAIGAVDALVLNDPAADTTSSLASASSPRSPGSRASRSPARSSRQARRRSGRHGSSGSARSKHAS